jgi:hypothetical protein
VAHKIYSCPACGLHNQTVLEDTTLLICKGCASVMVGKVAQSASIQTTVPADWTFIQLNTQGQYNQEAFTVVGRVRLQLRNDYKNFWFCTSNTGKNFILMESFGSFAVLTPSWYTFAQDARYLRAGESITLKGNIKLQGEYVEKCEAISFQGEIGSWRLFSPGFFFIQGSNKENKTAVFAVNAKDKIEYLNGEKIDHHALDLKNIIQWDEWK